MKMLLFQHHGIIEFLILELEIVSSGVGILSDDLDCVRFVTFYIQMYNNKLFSSIDSIDTLKILLYSCLLVV